MVSSYIYMQLLKDMASTTGRVVGGLDQKRCVMPGRRMAAERETVGMINRT
jgi:hypothetical protein